MSDRYTHVHCELCTKEIGKYCTRYGDYPITDKICDNCKRYLKSYKRKVIEKYKEKHNCRCDKDNDSASPWSWDEDE